VSLEPWHKYISGLRADFDAQPPGCLHDFFRLFGRFREFVADEWFVFSGEERVRLSTAGSHMLRLLVLYSAVVERRRSSPIVARLANVRWPKEDWMTKTVDALARVTSPD
jgi:hypothetical protein